MNRIYLDNAASTAILDEFKEYLLESFKLFANPSSLHSDGQKSKFELEKARKKVADILKVKTQDIVFTSGATESNNLIIKGIASKFKKGHIITSIIEHPSVLRVCEYLEENGYEVSYIIPNEKGKIDITDIKESIRKDTFLISIMAVNNETGVKQDIEEIAKIAKENNIYFHTDMVQLITKEKINLDNIDAISASFHKFHGPKGVGFAYIKDYIKLEKLNHGGSHERNKRAGTENLQGILLGVKALEYMYDNFDVNKKKIENLNNILVSHFNNNKNRYVINGEDRILNILNVQIKDKDINFLLPLLDMNNISVSGGSACQSGALKASNVLLKQGLTEKEAKSSIRISLSILNTEEEINRFLEILDKI